MTMHLEGPWLSTTGRKKGRKKFRNADSAQKSRRLKDDWQRLLDEHGVRQEDNKKKAALAAKPYVPPAPSYRGADRPRAPSIVTNTPAVCAPPPTKVYTGDKMIGIVVQHKSCLQPVFSVEEARDSAKMRR
jgi:hypothetical protein